MNTAYIAATVRLLKQARQKGRHEARASLTFDAAALLWPYRFKQAAVQPAFEGAFPQAVGSPTAPVVPKVDFTAKDSTKKFAQSMNTSTALGKPIETASGVNTYTTGALGAGEGKASKQTKSSTAQGNFNGGLQS